MSTRPRPKPRPRARVPTTEPPSSPGGPSTSLATGKPLEPVSINVEDEDARFFKNRNRTAQTWRKLNQLAEKSETRKAKAASDDDSDDGDHHRTPGRKYKKSTDKKESLPAWTKSVDAIEISSDSEEDELLRLVEDKSTPRATRPSTITRSGRLAKRPRSRSRSITPPPALPFATIMHARNTVRQMLVPAARAPSPTFVADDSVDGIELDPELAVIQRTTRIDVHRKVSATPATDASRSPSPARANTDDGVVYIKVRWKSHPLSPNPKSGVWGFKMRRNDSFHQLFDETADSAEVLADRLIITYDGNRIFPSASPHGVGVYTEAEFEACDKNTFEYLRTHRQMLEEDAGPSSREETPDFESVAVSEAAASEDEDDGRFKLILRSAVSKDITLTVRPTTKCGAIVKAFLKQAGIAGKYSAPPAKKAKRGKAAAPAPSPALTVDGERLNSEDEISVADLEDGDLVEVVGL